MVISHLLFLITTTKKSHNYVTWYFYASDLVDE